MKKGYYFAAIGVLIMIIVIQALLFLFQDSYIEVYGGESVFRIRESGNLQELAEQMTEREITELIIKNRENESVVICGKLLSAFSLKKERRNFLLRLESSRTELTGVTKIFLATQAKDQGVYHLNGTEQLSYHSTYDLIKRNIVVTDPETGCYQKGFLEIPEVLLTIPTEKDSLLFIYHNGEEERQKRAGSGVAEITAEHLLSGENYRGEGRILKGVWENPPSMSALMVYDLLMNSIVESPTLAVFVDGLGYKLWEYASERGFTDTFSGIEFEPMRVVYSPKTVYNYYAFGTGELRPEDRNIREELFSSFDPPGVISVPTETGTIERKGIIIEGEMQLYPSPIRQILHLPDRETGLVDPAIYRTALEAAGEFDFVFIHFHDIDYQGHSYGPYSEEVMGAIRRTGSYITGLAARWEGNFYVFSDHGMHQEYHEDTDSYTGTHYTATAEDMIGVFAGLSASDRGDEHEQ